MQARVGQHPLVVLQAHPLVVADEVVVGGGEVQRGQQGTGGDEGQAQEPRPEEPQGGEVLVPSVPSGRGRGLPEGSWPSSRRVAPMHCCIGATR